MMTNSGQVLAEVGGRKITQDDVISRLRFGGAWFSSLSELSDGAVISQAASKEGVSVSDNELQQEFDSFRRAQGLEKADDTHEWLDKSGLSAELVEDSLETSILASKLADKLIDDSQIESYYNQNPSEFEYARISHIVTENAGAAEELALSAREEGEDFAKLAKQHSVDKATSCGGGFLGLITRDESAGLPGEIAEKIFVASAGDVVGPFASGKAHCLIRVEEVGRRPLDDDLKDDLRQHLFGIWLGEKAAG